MAVTAEDIAARSGLTVNTVCRILRGENKETWPSAKARGERVRKLAAELGYKANTAARATRSKRFGQIGLITRNEIGANQLAVGKGVIAAAAEAGLHVLTASVDEETIAEKDVTPRLLTEMCVDGLVIHYARNIPDRFRQLVADYGVPAVWLNTKGEHNCVWPDELQGARLATRQLISEGRRQIVYIRQRRTWSGPAYFGVHFSEADREAGYVQAMTEAGLEPRVLEPAAPLEPEAGSRRTLEKLSAWRTWLAEAGEVDAALCYHPGEAAFLMLAATAVGREVPDALRVLAFYHRNAIEGAGVEPEIVTVPMGRAAGVAMDMLARMIDAGEQIAPSVAVPYDDSLLNTAAQPAGRGASAPCGATRSGSF